MKKLADGRLCSNGPTQHAIAPALLGDRSHQTTFRAANCAPGPSSPRARSTPCLASRASRRRARVLRHAEGHAPAGPHRRGLHPRAAARHGRALRVRIRLRHAPRRRLLPRRVPRRRRPSSPGSTRGSRSSRKSSCAREPGAFQVARLGLACHRVLHAGRARDDMAARHPPDDVAAVGPRRSPAQLLHHRLGRRPSAGARRRQHRRVPGLLGRADLPPRAARAGLFGAPLRAGDTGRADRLGDRQHPPRVQLPVSLDVRALRTRDVPAVARAHRIRRGGIHRRTPLCVRVVPGGAVSAPAGAVVAVAAVCLLRAAALLRDRQLPDAGRRDGGAGRRRTFRTATT